MDDLALVTEYMFLVTMLTLAAASAFFWMERDTLAPECRSAGTIAGMFTAVAAFVYWRMTSMVGGDGDPASIIALPTHYRYIDWVVTTPLIVLSLFVVLQAANERRGLALCAIALDVAMIVFGYFGELSVRHPERHASAWGFFAASCVACAGLIAILRGPLTRVAATRPEPMRRAYVRMCRFILLAWPVYPLCFAIALIVPGDEVKIARELIYNIADLINKIGFGVLALSAAREATEALQPRNTQPV
jgi:sensory rhodopsin